MRSLKGRLWLLWAMILAASVVVGLLLHQLYRTSTAAEVQRGEAVAARGCDLLRDRYQFWARGWDGSEFSAADPELVRDLRSVILSAVYGQRDLRAGIWSSEAGMLADVGAAPPDKGQDLSRLSDALTALNQLAARTEQTVTDLVEVREATVALAACPLTGPVSGLTGWVSNRIEGADDADPLRFGVGVLFLLVLGIGGWLLWLTTSWARRVGRIEAALAGGALEDWPVLSATGERELDRIVAALNDAGSRLAAARRRSEVLAGRVAQSERLASLGRVAAGVAHEIRNPMAALRLKAENALAGDDERRRRALEASLLQISRIDRLLTELLAMGRRAPPNPRRTSLESFLNSVVEEHREAARAKNIEVLCAASAMEATIDPELVRRILDNLLTNARQHTPLWRNHPRHGRRCRSRRSACGRNRCHRQRSGRGVRNRRPAVRTFRDRPARRHRPRARHRARVGRSAWRAIGASAGREWRHVRADAAPHAKRGKGGCGRNSDVSTILVVDDDAALRESLSETLGDLGHEVVEAADGERALSLLGRRPVDAVLLDLRMPGLDGMEVLRRIRAMPAAPPVAILTAVASAANTIEAMRLGAADHLEKPVGREQLSDLIGRMRARPAVAAAKTAPAEREELVGASAAMRTVQKTVGLLADSDATVLVTGETGTGKEVVARAIHRFGRRSAKPFVAVNCAAIPGELLESQLFGHVKGAFTGAIADRIGSFREADRGTLFLDEIGDMDLAMQAKLLRVLQERVVVPVGGKPVPIDVRIVAATHRNLPKAVEEGRFREDLYYRLGVVPLHLPPLRERLADILPLAEYFLALAAGRNPPRRLSPEAAAALLAHRWRGNVRELQNTMQRVTALVRQPTITAADLSFLADRAEPASSAMANWLVGTLDEAVERLETAMIREALAASGGNRAEAARQLGIHRQLLHTKLKRYAIAPDES